MHGKPLRPFGPPPLQGGGVLPPHLQLRRLSNPSQLSLGRYPTTRGSGRMSPRERNKFLFAGFGRISVTRILSLQSKTEKKAGIFCTKQPLCAVFYGGFLLFEALAAGTEKSEPRKRNSRPRKIFFKPRNFQPAIQRPFFPLFGTFSPTNPRCQYVGTSPARLTCPGNPGAETAVPATKRKPGPLFADIWISAHFARLRFLRPPPPPAPYK